MVLNDLGVVHIDGRIPETDDIFNAEPIGSADDGSKFSRIADIIRSKCVARHINHVKKSLLKTTTRLGVL